MPIIRYQLLLTKYTMSIALKFSKLEQLYPSFLNPYLGKKKLANCAFFIVDKL